MKSMKSMKSMKTYQVVYTVSTTLSLAMSTVFAAFLYLAATRPVTSLAVTLAVALLFIAILHTICVGIEEDEEERHERWCDEVEDLLFRGPLDDWHQHNT